MLMFAVDEFQWNVSGTGRITPGQAMPRWVPDPHKHHWVYAVELGFVSKHSGRAVGWSSYLVGLADAEKVGFTVALPRKLHKAWSNKQKVQDGVVMGIRGNVSPWLRHIHVFRGTAERGRLQCIQDCLYGIAVRAPGYRSRGPGFDSRWYQIFWEVVGLERGPLSIVRKTEGLLEWKIHAKV
jgi:hypothetical protein